MPLQSLDLPFIKILSGHYYKFNCFCFCQWATCSVRVEGELIHSTLTNIITLLQSVSFKGPPLSASSALLSQVNGLLSSAGVEQLEAVSNKKKMWSEANRRKTFCNWPHKDYKWAVPETMAQAGFYHQVCNYSGTPFNGHSS